VLRLCRPKQGSKSPGLSPRLGLLKFQAWPKSTSNQEEVGARILYMGSKNFVKAMQATHPPKSGNFSGSSVIKYSFLLLKFFLKLPHIFVKLQVLATKPSHDLYDSHHRTTSVPRGIKRGRVCV